MFRLRHLQQILQLGQTWILSTRPIDVPANKRANCNLSRGARALKDFDTYSTAVGMTLRKESKNGEWQDGGTYIYGDYYNQAANVDGKPMVIHGMYILILTLMRKGI